MDFLSFSTIFTAIVDFLKGILFFLRILKKKKKIIITKEFKEILTELENTNKSIFITGKAGTGKSTLLNLFKQKTKKKYVVLAPTGLAALNVGGQTIHSFFKFKIGIINSHSIQPDFKRASFFEQIDTIIVDEVSMVRADLMDAIDRSLRVNRNRLDEPFGGVQMIFIGDLFQLEPILVEKEKKEFNEKYVDTFFFSAKVFDDFSFEKKELTHIFRQEKDEKFKHLLNNIRSGDTSFDDFKLLNSRHVDNTGEQKNGVYLTARKDAASKLNEEELEKIKENEYFFEAIIKGKLKKDFDFKKKKLTKIQLETWKNSAFPAPFSLKLKRNAQIMMLNNDSAGRWVNGSIGKIIAIHPEKKKVVVKIEKKKYIVEPESWKTVEYKFNEEKERFEENILSEYIQFPIQLAWAITIHKSQGKTYDKATIDIGRHAFAHGQVYVALSRCKSLDGIVLTADIKPSDIILHKSVLTFMKNFNTPQNVNQQ